MITSVIPTATMPNIDALRTMLSMLRSDMKAGVSAEKNAASTTMSARTAFCWP